MSVVDITDLNNMIRGYMVNVVNEYYPEIDTSKNSVFDDIFIKPLINIVRPLVEQVSRLELRSNLSNAEFLTETELNEIGEGNYFMQRKAGYIATSIITLTFANLPVEDPYFELKIPSGTTFATSSGLEYQTSSNIIFSGEDVRKAYIKTRFVYELDVPVYASELGSKYNAKAGEISILKTYFSNCFVSCVNKADVVDGKDRESNKDYAERIKEFYLTRQLGTDPGYRRFILDMFEEITDIYVSGYKDEYMKRDVLDVWDKENQTVKTEHIGGKVDLYLKGCIFDENSQYITLNNEILVLDCNFDDLKDTSTPQNCISVFNLTDSSKTPVIKSVTKIGMDEFDGEYNNKVKVVIGNDRNISYTPDILSDMKIVYTFSKDGLYVDNEVYFNIGLSEETLAGPVKSVDFLMNVQDVAVDSVENRITVSRSGLEGTTQETCKVRLKNCNDYFNGYRFRIQYTSNQTLRRLGEVLNETHNRIVTTDVLAREATAVPINIQFRVKTTDVYRKYDTYTLESRIKASVNSFFSAYKMGDTVEESDIIGWLYTDASVKDIIQYIPLPLDVFYIPKNPAEEIPQDGTQHPSDTLKIKSIEYPILNANKFKISII